MSDVEWFESYKIGDPLIDEDHCNLFTEVSKFKYCIEKGASNTVISDFLNFLYHYVGVHFAREEHFMRKTHYPKYALHKELHQELKETVYAVRYIFKSKPDRVDQDKLVNFLDSWLKEHILEVDKALAPYVEHTSNIKHKKSMHQIAHENGTADELVRITLEIPRNKCELIEKCAYVLNNSTPILHDLELLVRSINSLTMEEAEEKAACVLKD
jgi:hemerythrin